MNFGAYDAAGASQFGGGGFMPSPAPGADNQYGAAGGGAQKGRNQNNSLRAFTIRHLLKETANSDNQDSFKADGHDISTVTIVGRVTSNQAQATRVLLQINDGTGSIEVCSWVDDADAQAQKSVDWQVGKYVRVYGSLKAFERRRSITSFAIKPILDHNEVTYHFLQSVMQHLHLTKGAPPTGQPAAGGHTGGRTPGGTSYGGAPATAAYGGAPHGAYGGGAPPPAGGAAGGDINSDVKHIYNLPHAVQAPNGLTLEQAHSELRNMGRNYSLQQVMQACEYLAAEGLLYSTNNDTTYKTTGA